MAGKSKIEWTHYTWNPVTGCSKISPGCKNCYAERFAKRLQLMRNPRYKNGFKVTLHPDLLSVPFRWKGPAFVFVNSMSDLFHEDVPLDFIKEVFKVMNEAKHLTFQILTKRSERLKEICHHFEWTENIWMGVTVENSDYIYRINHLLKSPAKIKFISFEPLLGPIFEFPIKGIDWVIVGGESGPGARSMKKEWVMEIYRQCKENGIPFFFKQWGGVFKHKNGRELNGKIYNEYPHKVSLSLKLFNKME
ncbi:DUF5131 family protein [Caldisericum exile]|uniref:DUF5131 family protein n=1 Tax=Caldisericum exile TaxID=693075 RepID=UPI003C730323